MTFLPIVERELRVASRKRATYWVRFTAALIAIVISAWVFLLMRQAPPAMVARSLFSSLAVLAFAFSLVAGVRNTADCVSEEKREDTLGLLFLTDLRGYDVVLGKLAANSLSSIYSLLGIFPVLALPLLLGGVQIETFLQMALLLANTLFFSLNAGMFVSALSRDARRAISGTLFVVLMVTAGWPAVGFLVAEYVQHKPTAEPALAFLLPSPGYAFGLLMGGLTGMTPRSPHFYSSLATTHVLGWLLLLAAAFILPRCWRDRPENAKGARLRERWRKLFYGSPTERYAFRKALLDINPFYWVTARDRFKSVLVWAVLLLAALGWLWGYWEWGGEWLEVLVGIWSVLVMHTILKCWIASEACRHLVEHRRSGALELLLSTPLQVRDILQGHLLALRRQFAGPVLVVVFVDILLLLLGLGRQHGTSDSSDMALLFIAGIIVLILDALALSWVGMWFGLSAKNLNRATSATLTRILALPWLLFIGSVMLLILADSFNRINMPDDFIVGLGWWLAIAVGVDFLLMAWARRNLQAQFRLIAAQHYAPVSRRAWWRFPNNRDQPIRSLMESNGPE